jgi:hypothetical protein
VVYLWLTVPLPIFRGNLRSAMAAVSIVTAHSMRRSASHIGLL